MGEGMDMNQWMDGDTDRQTNRSISNKSIKNKLLKKAYGSGYVD